jgi:hypothetical protein
MACVKRSGDIDLWVANSETAVNSRAFAFDTILRMSAIFTLFLHAIVTLSGLVGLAGSVLLLPNPS